ncbi:MAG: hypothetical protein RQ723_12825, partial [Desulfuromonadales bacterium]|nr:hypothetical protein [Desulfuromonadales bacterium]
VMLVSAHYSLMASQKLTNGCVATIISLLRRMELRLIARQLRALHLVFCNYSACEASPSPALRAPSPSRERERQHRSRIEVPFSPGEKVAEGRMRGIHAATSQFDAILLAKS